MSTYVTQAEFLHLHPSLLAAPESSAHRRARVALQLRDRHGRWIEMGGGVSFHVAAPGGGDPTTYHGTVVGGDNATGQVHVQLENGDVYSLPASKLEQPKAVIGLHEGAPAHVPEPDQPAAPTQPGEYPGLHGAILRTGVDDDVARGIDDTLRGLHAAYGVYPDEIVTPDEYRGLGGQFGHTAAAALGRNDQTGRTYLVLDAHGINNYEQLRAQYAPPGWTVTPTVNDAIVHEFGHLLDFSHAPREEHAALDQQVADRYFNGDLDAFSGAMTGLSGYAATNRNEAVAEAFALYRTNPNAPDWLKEWGAGMDRIWAQPPDHAHHDHSPQPTTGESVTSPGSQNRPVIRADDKRKSQGQTRTNFINETTGAPMGKTETGDTFERLFDNHGKKLLQGRYGDFELVTGAGGGTSRTTPLDLRTRTHGGELKTMSSKSKNLKTAIKAEEVQRKLNAVGSEKLKPLTLVQVVDQDTHRVELYGMEAFGSKAVSRMEHFGGYDYTPEDFAAAQAAAGHDDKAVARAFQGMTPEQKAAHVAHVQKGVPPREAARRAFGHRPDPRPEMSRWWDETRPQVTSPEQRDSLDRSTQDVSTAYDALARGDITIQEYAERVDTIISDLRRLNPPGSAGAPLVDRLESMLDRRPILAAAIGDDEPVTPQGPDDLVETNEELQSQPDNSDGVMIALKVPDAERYAVPDGHEPDDLHVTLTYLGRANELSPDQKQAVLDSAQHAAARFGRPPTAMFPYDYGTFDAEGGEGKPFVLHPYGQDLDELYAHVCNALKEHGLGDRISADHEFNPHVTLKYLDGESESELPHPEYTPPNMDEISFPQLRVSLGEDEHLIPLADHDDRPVRPQQILFSVEERIHDMVQGHNMSATRGTRASLPMLKSVYSREFQDTLPSPCQSVTASALSRCQRFLSSLSQRDLRSPDADLFPPADKPTPFSRTLAASASLKSDRIKDLLMDSVIAEGDDLRSFSLSRALAAATTSLSPQVRLELAPAIRTLLADGNSSAARSLRARMQLRDRYGRWIEMGRGIRFKVHTAGAPSSGTWHHGTVVGADVPNGLVSARLEDGRIVQLPADKVEQPKAIIGQHGENVLPETGPNDLDPNAPVIAHLDEVPEPVDAQDAVNSAEVRGVLQRISGRLHDSFRDNPASQSRPIARLQQAITNATRDLQNPDPTALDNASTWIDQFLRDNPSLNRSSRDALLFAQSSYADMAEVLRRYQHDSGQFQVQHHVQLPQEQRRPYRRFRNGRAEDDMQVQARWREIEDAGENTDVTDLETPAYQLPADRNGNSRATTSAEIRQFLMQDFGVGVSFPSNEQGHPDGGRINLHGDRNRIKTALEEVWGLTLDDDGHVVPNPADTPPHHGDEGPLESVDAAADALERIHPQFGGVAQSLRDSRAGVGTNPTPEQLENLSDELDGARQVIDVILNDQNPNGLDLGALQGARQALDEASTNVWDQARPFARAPQAEPAPEAEPDVNAHLRAFADQLDHALDALGDMEDARVPGIDQQGIRDRINRVQDDAAMNVPSERLQGALDEVMGQINEGFQDAGINPENDDLNADQESAYNEFRRQMQVAHDLATGEIHVPGGPGEPNADEMDDNPDVRDQFGDDVLEGFDFANEIVNNGARIQLYNHRDSSGREWQVGVRPDRLGNAPRYYVRSGTTHDGERAWVQRHMAENWAGVQDYFNGVEQDLEVRGVAEANRQRVDRERAQEAEREQVLHQRRVAENLNDLDQPLPPGWSRHQDDAQRTYYQRAGGDVLFQLDDGLAAYAQDPILGSRDQVGIYDDWGSALAGLEAYHLDKQLTARARLVDLLERNNLNFTEAQKDAILGADNLNEARTVLAINGDYRQMRAVAHDARGADRLNPEQRDAVRRDDELQAALRRIGDLPARPQPEANLNQDEMGRDLPTGWARSQGEEHSGEPFYQGPNGASAYVDRHLPGEPIQLVYNAPGGGRVLRAGLRDWDEVQSALEEAVRNAGQPVDLWEGAQQRADRDRETGYRDSLYNNLMRIGVDERVANQIMYLPSANDVRDYVSNLPEVRNLLADVANERTTDIAPIDQRNARLINDGIERVIDLGPDGNLLPALTPAPDPSAVTPDEDNVAEAERIAEQPAIPDDATDHPDDRGVAIAPEDLPRVGAPPGFERRYHPDGVIRDRLGQEIRRGVQVQSRHNGANIIGTVVAVQEQPPYARIQWPDGRRQLRAGSRLRVVQAAEVPGFNAPAAPAAAPENPAPAPDAPAPQGNAIEALQEIAEMHVQGANRGFPLLNPIGAARNNVNSALQAANDGDRIRTLAQVVEAVANYERGMNLPEFSNATAAYRTDVQERYAKARALQTALLGNSFPLGPPDPADEINALVSLRNEIPRRSPRGMANDARHRAYRYGGLALDDALPLIRNGNLEAAQESIRRAIFKFRQGGRQDLADRVEQHVAALRAMNLQPGAGNVPGEQPRFGDAPEPRDFIANRREGEEFPRAASPSTPGVHDPLDATGNPPHPEAANPNAVQADYAGWGSRAAEIAQAARVRPSIRAINEARGDPVRQTELVKAAFGGLPGTTFGSKDYVLRVNSSSFGDGSLSVSFSIKDSNGVNVGNGSRSLTRDTDGKWKAYNAGLNLRSHAQSSGFANALNRYFENFYIANGFKEVTVSASGGGGSTGGFAWAMNGFGFKNPSAEVPNILSRLERGTRQGSVESQVVSQMKARVAEATRTRNKGLYPTPMELALVGWAPGKTDWIGQTVMKGNSWGGIKKLEPTNVNWQQRQNYEIAKLAATRLENEENSFNVSHPFSVEVENMSAPGLREAGITPVEAQAVGQLMRAQNSSAAALPFTTKRKFLRWAGEQARSGNWNDDVENVAQTLQRELLADYPQEADLGIARQLQTSSFNELANNMVAGWNIQRLGPGEGQGINSSFRATHKASGQLFFVKSDNGLFAGRREVSSGAEVEGNVNALLRSVNWPGIEPAGVQHRSGQDTPGERREVIIQHNVGDNLDLVRRPQPAGALSDEQSNDAIRNLAQHDQLVRMFIMDGLIGNGDRHYHNYMLGQGTDGRWWLFPIDHGHSRGAPNGVERVDPFNVLSARLNDGGYNSRFWTALQEYTRSMSDENLERLLRGILNDYRQGASADPGMFDGGEFTSKIIQNIELLESRMAELMRLFKRR